WPWLRPALRRAVPVRDYETRSAIAAGWRAACSKSRRASPAAWNEAGDRNEQMQSSNISWKNYAALFGRAARHETRPPAPRNDQDQPRVQARDRAAGRASKTLWEGPTRNS